MNRAGVWRFKQAGDFARAGELQHMTIPGLEHELEQFQSENEGGFSKRMLGNPDPDPGLPLSLYSFAHSLLRP